MRTHEKYMEFKTQSLLENEDFFLMNNPWRIHLFAPWVLHLFEFQSENIAYFFFRISIRLNIAELKSVRKGLKTRHNNMT